MAARERRPYLPEYRAVLTLKRQAELVNGGNRAEPMNNIVIFEAEGQPVQVRLEGETVWLSQSQIAELFTVTPQNVTTHLKNIYAEYELVENSTCKDFLQVQTEGNREVKRKRKHYNLAACRT